MATTASTKGKRILILGAGRIGEVHARALSRISEIETIAICDPNISRAQRIAARYRYQSFDNPEKAIAEGPWDGIVIGSPSPTHLPMVRLAARHGIHIFCEKPLALKTPDIEEAISICDEANVALQIGFNRRFDPSIGEIAKTIHEGGLGRPFSLRIVNRDASPPPREFIRYSGGMFFDMTIHDFDLARYLLQEEVEEITATGSCLVDSMFADEGDYDVTACMMRFTSGAIGLVENSRATPYGYDQRLEILGSQSALELKNQTAVQILSRDARGETSPPPLPHFLQRYDTAFLRQMESFIAALSAPKPTAAVKVTGRDALSAHFIAEAATRSSKEGRPVKVAHASSLSNKDKKR